MKVFFDAKSGLQYTWCEQCGAYFEINHLHFSEDDVVKSIYEQGYDDGFINKPARLPNDALYNMGWEDGYSDNQAGVENPNYRPVDPDYALIHEAPEGFEWTGEKRTPGPGDIYLTKNGNPKFQKEVRKNNQTRHLLRASASACVCRGYSYNKKWCKVHKWDK